tara:strand:+ start:1125 stop:1550 length:426 start_codon:yes stop_codon:yes gene_type:complete
MFGFGNKIAGAIEKGTRFGDKVLGSVARFGDKVQSGVGSIQKGIASSSVLGKVADVPIAKGVSANMALGAIGAGAGAVADTARAGQEVLKMGSNLVRTGRGIAEAGSISQAGAIADDMMRQGRSMGEATKAIGRQIQKMRP